MSIHPSRILFQDAHFLAVHKLPGELVVKGKGEVGKLPLLDFLKKEFPGIHPLNRLDFDTSGIVLFARNRAVLQRMLEEKPPMRKVYRTLVIKDLPKDRGEILFRLPSRAGKGDTDALTRYRVLARFGSCSSVEVEIQTGRHHQIRRHFQMLGHPLVNDPLYGDKKWNRRFIESTGFRKMFLHAAELSFNDPFSGKSIKIADPLPEVFGEALKKIQHTHRSRDS
ncbi:MAG: 23S rRNA pseudouridine955/2504/2580 synthase [Candidatus Peregrinibacteria bacterium Greene0416_19]|nr:MAG: 23S rRNA pseudouridine955/2504/2580 synthase [Candidatus Peregrinibacteria bacterium Greene0416_19]